jgi:hypothetical protein
MCICIQPIHWILECIKREGIHSLFCHVTSFNRDIGSCDVSSVTNMEDTFKCACICFQPRHWSLGCVQRGIYEENVYGDDAFNQDIASYDVSRVFCTTKKFRDSVPTIHILPIACCIYYDADADQNDMFEYEAQRGLGLSCDSFIAMFFSNVDGM